MKTLVQEFIESPDANSRLLGLTTLNNSLTAENGAVFSQRLLTKLKGEQIPGIINQLVKMLQKVVTKENYQQIIAGLMQHDSEIVMDVLMEIEAELKDVSGFNDFFLANVTLPLLGKGAK